MKGANDIDVERMRAVDVARLHHFLFEIDGIARIDARPRILAGLDVDLARRLATPGWIWLALVVAIDRCRCDSTAPKRLHVARLIARRVGVGDIGGDGRLSRRRASSPVARRAKTAPAVA